MDLHLKYRPEVFEEVIGQDAIVESLKTLLEKEDPPHSYLFSGPSGVGKTSLARLVATSLECDPTTGIIEVDAATHSGIAEIKAVTGNLIYKAFGEDPRKLVILDECQAMSRQAWQSLLKIVEEPPKHVYFVFCTTQPEKVQNTIKTRCHWFKLKEVSVKDIIPLLYEVCSTEKDFSSIDDDAIEMIAKASMGSPRQALVYLSMCSNAKTIDDVAEITSRPHESGQAFELARMIVNPKLRSTEKTLSMLKDLREQDPEGIRKVISNYLVSCILNSKNERGLLKLLPMLDAFSRPFQGIDQVILATFDSMLSEDD